MNLSASSPRSTERDEAIAALELDRYIDGLLALRDEAAARRLRTGATGRRPAARSEGAPADAGPRPEGPATLDGPSVRLTADRLAESLVRVHPSFRFEERLSRRLAALAAAMGGEVGRSEEPELQSAGRRVGRPELPGVGRPEPARAGTLEPSEAATPEPPEAGTAPVRPSRRERLAPPVPVALRHPLVIGGITSAAISIAGAAFLAWRRTRPRHPMARVVRLAHGALGATGSLGATGTLGATGPLAAAAALAERTPRTDRRPRRRRSAILAGLALRAIERRPPTGGASGAPGSGLG